ncbi:MAG: Oligosaccharide translocation protein rft1 [Trizodia sp. TS-e1964]|nr:MAG: Oligosaccharide translocation protein rft1 [Trizodia sp. TS-e1964]
MKLLRALTVLLLPLPLFAAKKAPADKFQQFHAKSLVSTPLKLDDPLYDALTASPRDYSVVVLLTAMEARFGCQLCREFQPEWDLLSRTWIRGDKAGASRLVFGTLDFADGKEAFQKLQLQTAPIVILFNPTIGPNASKDGKPIRLEFSGGPHSAEQVHAWLSRNLPEGPRPKVSRPINYTWLFAITTVALGALTLISVTYPYLLPIIQNKNVWAAISLITILLFTSGHMFNHIRNVPYVSSDGHGGISYFANGFQTQFGLETQIIAALYSSVPPASRHATLLASSARGATFLILLSILSRGLTFSVNQFLLRYISPERLGLATQLELYLTTVLYFARESLRVAVQRLPAIEEEVLAPENAEKHKEKKKDGVEGNSPLTSTSHGGRLQTVVNASYISLISGLLLALALGQLYARTSSATASTMPHFVIAVELYGVAAVLELLAEPCFAVAQQRHLFRVRAAAEAGATLFRCGLTGGITVWAARRGKEVGVLPFAAGHVGYSLVLGAVYLWGVSGEAKRSGVSLGLKPVVGSEPATYIAGYFLRPLMLLAGSLFAQSVVKHFLTAGDQVLIGALANLQDVGVYALAANYGGLIARMLFQPIEESSRSLFAALLAQKEGQVPASNSEKKSPEVLEKSRQRRIADVNAAAGILSDILRFYMLVSIVAASIGPTAAPLLLRLVAGARWTATGAADVLSAYSYYIPLLALNGVTEAFVAAVATPAEVRGQSVWMFAFSMGFAGAAYIFLRGLGWGARGLVAANAANMLLRTAWSAAFIKRYLRRNGGMLSIVDILPSKGSIAVGVGAAAILARAQAEFSGRVLDYVKCAGVAGPLLLMLFYLEMKLLVNSYRMMRSGKSAARPK